MGSAEKDVVIGHGLGRLTDDCRDSTVTTIDVIEAPLSLDVPFQKGQRRLTGQIDDSKHLSPWQPGGVGQGHIKWDLRWVPGECRKHKVTRSTLSHATKIAIQSDTVEAEVNRLRDKVAVEVRDAGPKVPTATKGETGRGSDGKVSIALYGNHLESEFEAAHTLVHELEHTNRALERGFTVGEAATVLTVDQFKALRWDSEAKAFDAQARGLREIAATSKDFEVCRDLALEKDPGLRELGEAERTDQIVDRYPPDVLEQEHLSQSQDQDISAETRKAIERFRDSGDFANITKRWQQHF